MIVFVIHKGSIRAPWKPPGVPGVSPGDLRDVPGVPGACMGVPEVSPGVPGACPGDAWDPRGLWGHPGRPWDPFDKDDSVILFIISFHNMMP